MQDIWESGKRAVRDLEVDGGCLQCLCGSNPRVSSPRQSYAYPKPVQHLLVLKPQVPIYWAHGPLRKLAITSY